MGIYKIPIATAFIIFPFVAFVLTLPFLIHEYRKYGSIPFIKSVIFYSMILYLITAYFMVILPLPKISEVTNYTGKTMQLVPFQFIKDIQITTNLKITDLNSLLLFLNKSTVYTVIFNLLLTLPFGVYLRYFFKKKWYQVIIYTFTLSLFFELTQLSGLYGLYPRPYRLFDVDDLIVNTLGGLIGFIATPFIAMFLPTKDELNNISYIKGQKVSILRRSVALFIDIVFLSIFTLIFNIITLNTKYNEFHFLLAIIFYYIFIPLFNNSKTFGKVLVKLEIISTKEKYYYLRLIVRNLLLSFLILYPISWLAILKGKVVKEIFNIIVVLVITLEILNILYYFFKGRETNQFLYESITQTKNKSSIIIHEEKTITKNKNNENDTE